MIKFIHKKHIHKDPQIKGLAIYYSLSDIILGFLLIVLVAFFIYSYLEFSFNATGQISNITTEKMNSQYNPNILNKPIK